MKLPVITFLVFLLVLGSVSAQTDTQIKELNFLEKLLLSFGSEPFAVSLTNLNPDPGEIITYKGYGTVPSKVCEAIDFYCKLIDPKTGAMFYESCVRPIIVDKAEFNLNKELGDTGSPDPNIIQTIDKKQVFGDFLAKRQTELAQQGSSVCGKTYSVSITQNAPTIPDKYWMFFDWKARDAQGNSFFVASSGKSFTVGAVDVGVVEADLSVTFTNSDGTTNTPSNPQTFVAGETKAVKYNTNKAVSNIGCDTPLPSGIKLQSISSFTKTFTFSFDSLSPSEATLTCRFDSKPFSLYMKKATAQPPPTPSLCGNGVCDSGETSSNCVQDCPVIPLPLVTNDKDGDTVIDSEDKCPDTPGSPTLGTAAKGCPWVYVYNMRVLGNGKYNPGDRVPVLIQVAKDPQFDLTGLKLEVGIYKVGKVSEQPFSIAGILGSRNLAETVNCVPAEDSVQTATIQFSDKLAFSSTPMFANDASFIMLPKAPNQQSRIGDEPAGSNWGGYGSYIVSAGAYYTCGGKGTTTFNNYAYHDGRLTQLTTKVDVVSMAQPKNIVRHPTDQTCVTVSGTDTQYTVECPFESGDDPGQPLQTGELCSKAIAMPCTPIDVAGPDDSGPSTECASGWCSDTTGSGGRCASAGTMGDGETILKDAEPHPTCVALGTPKEKGLCSFLETLAFFHKTEPCTEGGLVLVGAIIILFGLFFVIGGKK